MSKEEILKKLEELGKERTKAMYIERGAKEPCFGVPVGHLKPIVEAIGTNQELANELFETGIFDAMYLAGILANPNTMSEENFEEWISKAYTSMLSDVAVAVTLSESPLAFKIADKWAKSENELYRSSAWSTYQWVLKSVPDDKLEKEKIHSLLNEAVNILLEETDHVHRVVNDFIAAVGTNYIPLHEEAKQAAAKINELGKPLKRRFTAEDKIKIDVLKNKLGMKKPIPRC